MNKFGRRGTWKLTDFGYEIRIRLIEKNMTSVELAQAVGISESFLSQILYGYKKGDKYIKPIQELLGMKEKEDRKKVSGK